MDASFVVFSAVSLTAHYTRVCGWKQRNISTRKAAQCCLQDLLPDKLGHEQLYLMLDKQGGHITSGPQEVSWFSI